MSVTDLDIEIWGKHVVEEALRSRSTRVHEIFVVEGKGGFKVPPAVPVRQMGAEALRKRLGTEKHQNVGARVTLGTWGSLKDWFSSRSDRPRPFLGIAVDGIEDPQNFGTLLRAAHFFGAEVCLTTRDRAAPLTGVVAKASTGALFSVPIVRAVNLARELEACEELGIWRIGLDAGAADSLASTGLGEGHVLLVVGSEGEGLRTLTAKRCDKIVSLPGSGGRESLNAAVAGSIALYEIDRQRRSTCGPT